MPKQSIRWMSLLKKHTNWIILPLTLVAAFAMAEEQLEEPIQYEVTAVKGYLYGTVDGETAYKDWRRGTFDKERMTEVKPKELPDNLPEPVVIPFVESKVREVPVGKPKRPPLKGEDKIFVQIGEDEIKARCFILGEGCEQLEKPEEQDSVYYKAIEKAQEKQQALKQGEAANKGRAIIKP